MKDEGEFSDLINDSLKANTSGQTFLVAVKSHGLLCAAKCFTLITGFHARDEALAAR